MNPGTGASARDVSVVWHDVECAGYSADLELWKELADASSGPVLDLGCGVGRVGLWLAQKGHQVVGLDTDGDFISEFNRRALDLPARARVGDAGGFELEESFDLVLAPMQLVQLLDAAEERVGCLASAARCLRPGGMLAAAIVEEAGGGRAGESTPPLPDVREVNGWVYSSLPLETVVDGDTLVVRRLRQTVAPDGDLSEEVNEIELRSLTAADLEFEGSAAGLWPAGLREIPATEAHVGSTVVLLEKEAS